MLFVFSYKYFSHLDIGCYHLIPYNQVPNYTRTIRKTFHGSLDIGQLECESYLGWPKQKIFGRTLVIDRMILFDKAISIIFD